MENFVFYYFLDFFNFGKLRYNINNNKGGYNPPVVVVENNIIYINIIVGARVARHVDNLLVFTTQFATDVLETIVLA